VGGLGSSASSVAMAYDVMAPHSTRWLKSGATSYNCSHLNVLNDL